MISQAAEATKDNPTVDSYATRSGWYYVKRDADAAEEPEAEAADGPEVDRYATRSGWYYVKRDTEAEPLPHRGHGR